MKQLTPELLISAYCQGAFPMAPSRHAPGIDWYSPDPRAVLPLDTFTCPRTVRQKITRKTFDIRVDTAFEPVVRACAQARSDHPDTWINDEITYAYTQLHRMGLAHSVEAWRDGQLVGGLYGVALGGLFAGESMFHDPRKGGTDASKVCLVHLVEHLRGRGYVLLDVQTQSPHMASLGTIEIPRREYLRNLAAAIKLKVTWGDGE